MTLLESLPPEIALVTSSVTPAGTTQTDATQLFALTNLVPATTSTIIGAGSLAGVCGHRAHADGSSARKAADFLGSCRGRR